MTDYVTGAKAAKIMTERCQKWWADQRLPKPGPPHPVVMVNGEELPYIPGVKVVNRNGMARRVLKPRLEAQREFMGKCQGCSQVILGGDGFQYVDLNLGPGSPVVCNPCVAGKKKCRLPVAEVKPVSVALDGFGNAVSRYALADSPCLFVGKCLECSQIIVEGDSFSTTGVGLVCTPCVEDAEQPVQKVCGWGIGSELMGVHIDPTLWLPADEHGPEKTLEVICESQEDLERLHEEAEQHKDFPGLVQQHVRALKAMTSITGAALRSLTGLGVALKAANLEPDCVCKNYQLGHEPGCEWKMWRESR